MVESVRVSYGMADSLPPVTLNKMLHKIFGRSVPAAYEGHTDAHSSRLKATLDTASV